MIRILLSLRTWVRWLLTRPGSPNLAAGLSQSLVIWLIAAILVAALPAALPMAAQGLGLLVLLFPALGAFLLGLGAAMNWACLRASTGRRMSTPSCMSNRRTLGLGAAAVLSVFLLIGAGVSALSGYNYWQALHGERVTASCGLLYADVKEDVFRDREWWNPAVKIDDFGPIQTPGGTLNVDLLLITANQDEWAQVARAITAPTFNVRKGDFVYTLGRFGACTAALIRCSQGSAEQTASQIATLDGIAFVHPKLVLCLGGAFGASRQSQAPGDVLVSSCAVPYEHQKVCCGGLVWKWRGSELTAWRSAVDLFPSDRGWDFETLPGRRAIPQKGPIVSGEKLVNSAELKCVILQSCCPDAIGGDMEGAGVAVAANHEGIPWLVIKGVMDWGDGHKNDAFKKLASAAAVSYALHVLGSPQAPAALAGVAAGTAMRAPCACGR